MLSIKELSVSYGNTKVLENLSVNWKAGCVHGIVGLNGSGKTTFLNALFGIKKKDRGTVLWKGLPLKRTDIGFLETENFFYSRITGTEYLSLFPTNLPRYNQEEWNRLFNLPLQELIENYSTGMKQKLALMGLMKQNKPLLILDEPFNGLDMEASRVLMLILHRLRGQGTTILLTSHILQSLTGICDYIHLLRGRKIVLTRSRDEFSILEKDLFQELDAGYRRIIGDIL